MENKQQDILKSHLRNLYVMAALAAMVIALCIVLQFAVYAILPPPESVTGWFELFRRSKITGLIEMDILLTINYLLFVVVFMALWAALRKSNPMLTFIALLIQLLAIAAYFTSGGALEMLELSQQYDARGSYVDNIILRAAGESVLSGWHGTACNVSYMLSGIAVFTMSFVMMKSHVFSKANAYPGIVAGILMIVLHGIGKLGAITAVISLLPVVPWMILMGFRFLKLSRARIKAF
jgi:hypothetical protein